MFLVVDSKVASRRRARVAKRKQEEVFEAACRRVVVTGHDKLRMHACTHERIWRGLLCAERGKFFDGLTGKLKKVLAW